MIDENKCKKIVERLYQNSYVDLKDCDVISQLVEEYFNQLKVNEWIPFAFDEEGMLACRCPEIDEEILVSDGISVWVDTWIEYEGYGLDSNNELVGLAWQSLPNPYEDEEE